MLFRSQEENIMSKIIGIDLGTTNSCVAAVSYTHLDVYKRQDMSIKVG